MVVVGTFKSPSIRNFFEDEFVKQLQEHGIEAIASYTFVPIVDLTNKDSVNTKIKEIGVDAVLVTRLVDKKTVENYVQGRVTVVPNYSHHRRRHNFDYIYTPGYMVEEEYAYAETNIYDIRSEKLIWSALSTTKISGRDQDLIKSFVKVMVDKL
jgi:predicted transcriptional regulator